MFYLFSFRGKNSAKLLRHGFYSYLHLQQFGTYSFICVEHLTICSVYPQVLTAAYNNMILIVDDKPENIFSLRTLLEINGFEVDTAENGEEALKKILRHTYAVIILDVQMPGMDGFEVAETISGYSKAKNIHIIFLSAASTEKRFITKGYTSGGMDYVTKPVDADILLLKVKTFYKLYEQKKELNDTYHSLREEVEIRKQTENELTQRVNELRSVLESMPEIAFTLKPDGKIEFVNEHWYLYAAGNNSFPEIHPADMAPYAQWHAELHMGRQLVCELRIRNLVTHEFRYHTLRIIPVKQGDAILKWVGTFTDIHVQKQTNELLETRVKERTRELLAKNEELEARNLELQQFASVASHDLKEPLRKIQVFSSIILDRYLSHGSEAMSYMNRIVESSRRMSGLINDLLDYSSLSITSLFQPTDLSEIILAILQDLELSIREKDAIIEANDLPTIDAIPGQMRQVFQNLLSNALKFSRKDIRPVIGIYTELFTDEASGKDMCRITVSDNGIGFDERYVNKIFTLFQRLNPREAYEGTGIGLAIAKKIIDNHSGTITARSAENEGAHFIITLPVHQDDIHFNHTIEENHTIKRQTSAQ